MILQAIRGRDLLRKCQFPLMLSLGTLPLALLILHGFAPDQLPILWIFPAAYVLLSWLCLLTPGKLRLPLGVIGSAGFVAAGLYLLPIQQQVMCLLLPLMYAALLLYTLPIGRWSRDTELSIPWLAAFAVMHVIGQVFVNIADSTGNFPVFAAARTALLLAFILCTALCMLSLNRTTMQDASMGRQRVPASMRRRNVIFSLLILALILFLAALPQVIATVKTLWDGLLQCIVAVVSFLVSLMSRSNSSSGDSGGGGEMDLSGLGGESAEPSLFAIIMEKVFFGLAMIVAVALIIFVLVKLWQKLRVLMQYMAQRVLYFARSASEDFEDEITDTRDDTEQERISLLSSLRKRFAHVDERRLTPAQRIRHRYLRLMMKHPEWRASQTAREGLPPDAASLYERVRYSGEDVSPDEADAFAQQIKPL